MKVPFRLRVLQNLTKCIEQVRPENGAHYDLSSSVFRGRLVYSSSNDDPLPMVSILEAPIPPKTLRVDGEGSASAGVWELLIQGFVKDDAINPTDPAHHLMAEVKAVLVKERFRDRGENILGMQGRVYELEIGQGVVRPPDHMSETAFFWLQLNLRIAEYLDDPYK